MDIVERLRDDESMYDADDVDLHLDAVEEIERLREERDHDLKAINALELSVIKLTVALQAVVDAHGTGQGIGAQGVGGWLDQARQTLEEIK